VRNLAICIQKQIFFGRSNQEEILGGSCSTYVERMGVCMVWVGKPEENCQLEESGIEGKTVLKCIFRKWFGGMYWIGVAQFSDRRWEFVNAVMNLTVP
jgi:hypothetical protein